MIQHLLGDVVEIYAQPLEVYLLGKLVQNLVLEDRLRDESDEPEEVPVEGQLRPQAQKIHQTENEWSKVSHLVEDLSTRGFNAVTEYFDKKIPQNDLVLNGLFKRLELDTSVNFFDDNLEVSERRRSETQHLNRLQTQQF